MIIPCINCLTHIMCKNELLRSVASDSNSATIYSAYLGVLKPKCSIISGWMEIEYAGRSTLQYCVSYELREVFKIKYRPEGRL